VKIIASSTLQFPIRIGNPKNPTKVLQPIQDYEAYQATAAISLRPPQHYVTTCSSIALKGSIAPPAWLLLEAFPKKSRKVTDEGRNGVCMLLFFVGLLVRKTALRQAGPQEEGLNARG